jgi:hypothetical protein
MKKLMFLLAAASLSSVAFAQQKSNSQNVLVGESVDVMEVPVDKYKVETNHFFDNWFFSVGGGAQVLFGDQSDLGKFKKRIAPALQISIDHNIPLITNARLASAFIEAFCEMSEKDIQIKSWQDYK